MCRTRGHVKNVHAIKWKSQQQLRDLFMANFYHGLYPSIPSLFHFQGERDKARHLYHYHWILGHNAQRQKINMTDVWQYGHIKEPLIIKYTQQDSDELNENNEREHEFKLLKARENVKMTDPKFFIQTSTKKGDYGELLKLRNEAMGAEERQNEDDEVFEIAQEIEKQEEERRAKQNKDKLLALKRVPTLKTAEKQGRKEAEAP